MIELNKEQLWQTKSKQEPETDACKFVQENKARVPFAEK